MPKMGSIVGYLTIKSLAAGIAKAGSTDTEKLVDAFRGLKMDGPLGPFSLPRHRSPVDARRLCRQDRPQERRGHMVDYKYVDGASVLPPDAEVRKLRPGIGGLSEWRASVGTGQWLQRSARRTGNVR